MAEICQADCKTLVLSPQLPQPPLSDVAAPSHSLSLFQITHDGPPPLQTARAGRAPLASRVGKGRDPPAAHGRARLLRLRLRGDPFRLHVRVKGSSGACGSGASPSCGAWAGRRPPPRCAPPTVQAVTTCASLVTTPARASSADQAPTGADLRTPPPLVLRSQLPH